MESHVKSKRVKLRSTYMNYTKIRLHSLLIDVQQQVVSFLIFDVKWTFRPGCCCREINATKQTSQTGRKSLLGWNNKSNKQHQSRVRCGKLDKQFGEETEESEGCSSTLNKSQSVVILFFCSASNKHLFHYIHAKKYRIVHLITDRL